MLKMKKIRNAIIRSENENSDKNQFDNQINRRFYHSPAIRKSFDLLVKDELLIHFLIFACRLVDMIDIMIKDLSNIDEVYSSFNNLLNSKCIFYFDTNRKLYYDFSSWENYEDSPEQLLIIILGICAAFRINLELLENTNDHLKEINEFLLKEFPEPYNAYCALSRQFEFMTSMHFYGEPFVTK
jgi:hypothetical protein